MREPHALALTDSLGRIAGVIIVVPLALDSVGFLGLIFLYGTSMQWSSSEVLRFGIVLVTSLCDLMGVF